jgi:hypothetical protein
MHAQAPGYPQRLDTEWQLLERRSFIKRLTMITVAHSSGFARLAAEPF